MNDEAFDRLGKLFKESTSELKQYREFIERMAKKYQLSIVVVSDMMYEAITFMNKH